MSEIDDVFEYDREQTVACTHCGRRFQMSTRDIGSISRVALLCNRCMDAGFGFGDQADTHRGGWYDE